MAGKKHIIALVLACASLLRAQGTGSAGNSAVTQTTEFQQQEDEVYAVTQRTSHPEQQTERQNMNMQLYGSHNPGSTGTDHSSGSSVHRSRVIQYLLSTNPVVCNLRAIVDHWARVRKLDQTSHMISLMLIFFLQQKNILPPIVDLQKNAKPIMVDHWNVAYQQKKIRADNEVLTVLLVEFLEYYTTFDYGKDVISPYIGYPLNKERIVDFKRLPNEFNLYKHNVSNNLTSALNVNSTIVVQDIFEHNKNIAIDVSEHCAEGIITEFRTSYDAYLVSKSFNLF